MLHKKKMMLSALAVAGITLVGVNQTKADTTVSTFSDLQSALLSETGTITINGDITADANLNAITNSGVIITPGSSAVTLDGNNHKGFAIGDGISATVNGNNKLTFSNFHIGSYADPYGSTFSIGENGTLALNNIIATNNSTTGTTRGGFVGIDSGGTLTSISGTFKGNSSSGDGGVIFNFGGHIGSINGTFGGTGAGEGNSVSENNAGGVIYSTGGSIDSLTGTFINNSAGNIGGVLWANSRVGTFLDADTPDLTKTAISGTFKGNSSGRGGAIFNLGRISKIDATFGGTGENEGNTASSVGGAIYNNNGARIFQIKGAFTNNSASSGGAIYNIGTIGDINNSDTIAISTTFTGNTAEYSSGYSGNGGAIFSNGTITQISGSTFTNNHADNMGGAIYNDLYGVINSIDNTTFTNNSAENGGALYNVKNSAQSGVIYSMAGTYTNNTATNNGGAIYNEGIIGNTESPTTTAITGTFTGNSATRESSGSGGAIYNTGTITKISGATFGGTGTGAGNTAGLHGGAIYNSGNNAAINSISANFTNNSAENTGGAISNYTNAKIGSLTGTFTGNSSEFGGAIYNKGTIGDIDNLNTTAISGTFKGNSAVKVWTTHTTGMGGAIDNEGTITKIANATFGGTGSGEGNTSARGGAIYNASVIDSISANFYNNSATVSDGGAINNASVATIGSNANTTAITGTFQGNSAVQYGGAIYNAGSITKIADATFGGTGSGQGNSAEYGGAIYNSGTIESLNANFIGNTSTDSGGAIYNRNTGVITLVSSSEHNILFEGNKQYFGTANEESNAIYNNGTVNMNAGANSTITFNDGIINPGGIVLNGAGTVIFNNKLANGSLDLTSGTMKLGSSSDVTLYSFSSAGGTGVLLDSQNTKYNDSASLGIVNLTNPLNINIDVDASTTSALSDSITVSTGSSSGVFNINSLYFKGIGSDLSTIASKVADGTIKDFTLQILNNNNANTYLTINSALKNAFDYDYTDDIDHGGVVNPTSSHIAYSDQYGGTHYNLRTQKSLSIWGGTGTTDSGLKNAIRLVTTETHVNETVDPTENLTVINTYSDSGYLDRSISFAGIHEDASAHGTYTMAADTALGTTTAGKMTLAGVMSSGASPVRTTVDLNGNSGYDLTTNATELVLENLILTNNKANEAIITVGNTGSKVTLNNSVVDGDIDGSVLGTSLFNLTNSNESEISGNVSNANIANSGNLTLAGNVSGAVSNASALILKGTTIDADITGAGHTDIDANGTLTFNGDVSQDVNVITGTLVNSEGQTITGNVTVGTLNTDGTIKTTATVNNNGAIVGNVWNDWGSTFNNNKPSSAATITGTVTNAGTFTNAGDIGGAATDSIGNHGTFTNSGNITINIKNQGTFTNSTGGLISASIENAAPEDGNPITQAVLTNDSTISGGITNRAGQKVINNNLASGAVQNFGIFDNNATQGTTGVWAKGFRNEAGATLNNNENGSIFYVVNEATGTVNNAANAVIANIDNGGAVVNNGTINGGVENYSTGTITSNADNITSDSNYFLNDGLVTFTGGSIQRNIAKYSDAQIGTIEIAGDISLNGKDITDNNVKLTSGIYDVTSKIGDDGNFTIPTSKAGDKIIANGGTLSVQDGKIGDITLGEVDTDSAALKVMIDAQFTTGEQDENGITGTADKIVNSSVTTAANKILISDIKITADPIATYFKAQIADDTSKGSVDLSATTLTGLSAGAGDVLLSYSDGWLTGGHSDLDNAITSTIITKIYSIGDNEIDNSAGALTLGGTSLSITGNDNTIISTSNTQGGIAIANNGQTLSVNGATFGSNEHYFTTAIDNTAGGTINLTNISFNSNNTTDVINDGEGTKGVFLSGTNSIGSIVDSVVAADPTAAPEKGQTTVSSGTSTIGSLIQKNVNILSEATLNIDADKLVTSDTTNNKGTLNLSGTTTEGSYSSLASNIVDTQDTKTGITNILGNVDTNGHTITQSVVNVGKEASGSDPAVDSKFKNTSTLAVDSLNVNTEDSNFTNTAGTTTTPNTIGTLTNNGSVNNSGVLSIGTLVNAGPIDGVTDGGTTTYGDITVANGGSSSAAITQNNITLNGADSTFNNTAEMTSIGTFINHETITGDDGTLNIAAGSSDNTITQGIVHLTGGAFDNDANITAKTLLDVDSNATLTNDAVVTAAKLENDGIINQATEAGGTLKVDGAGSYNANSITQTLVEVTGGDFTNNENASIEAVTFQNDADATYTNKGNMGTTNPITTITNNGTSFTNDTTGAIHAVTLDNNTVMDNQNAIVATTVENDGTYTNTGATSSLLAKTINNNDGTFANDGTIGAAIAEDGLVINNKAEADSFTNTGSGSIIATTINNDSSLINEKATTSTGGSIETVDMNNNDNASLENNGSFTSTGTFTNAATATVNNNNTEGEGTLSVNKGTNEGIITQGTINVAANNSPEGFNNTNSITAETLLNNDGTLNNSSVITVANSTNDATLDNSGDINTTNNSSVTANKLINTDGNINMTKAQLTVTNQDQDILGTVNVKGSNAGNDVSEMAIAGANPVFAGALNVGNSSDSSVKSTLKLLAGDVDDNATVNIAKGNVLNVAQDTTKGDEASVVLNENDKYNGDVVLDDGTVEMKNVSYTTGDKSTTKGGKSPYYEQNGGNLALTNAVLTMEDSSKINGGNMQVDTSSVFNSQSNGFNVDTLTNSGLVNAINGNYENYSAKTILAGDGNKDNQGDFAIDIFARDKKNTNYDKFGSSSTRITATNGKSGVINISDWSLNGDLAGSGAPIERSYEIDAFKGSATKVRFTATDKEVFTPLGWYRLNNKGGSSGKYSLDLVRFNPQAYRGQVTTLAQWQNQLAIDDMLFTHSMVLPGIKDNEYGMAYSSMVNKIASTDPVFAPYQYSRKDGGLWYKAYGNFEKLEMTRNIGKVGNNAYGSLIGADFGLKELRNGWKFMPTAYIGYNGAHQHFQGNSAYQNGMQAGLMGTWYKDNFLVGTLAYGGIYDNIIDLPTGHTDRTFDYFGGAATKAAYNIKPHKDFAIQPNLFLAYNYFGQQNFHTDFGQMGMMSGTLNGVNIAPGVNLIWEKETFSVYGTLQYMFNANGAVGGRGGNVDMPRLAMERGYIQYGLGATKKFTDRASGYFQSVLRNVGRTGVGFQAGFQFKIGKDYSNVPTKKTYIKPKNTQNNVQQSKTTLIRRNNQISLLKQQNDSFQYIKVYTKA